VVAYQQLMRNGHRGEVYNVGSGIEAKLQDILESLIPISGTNTIFEIDPARLRPNEIRRIYADVSKLRSVIDWQPKYSLKETLSDCFEATYGAIRNSEGIKK
jgi:GDP-4-dehydro-6-deoxy-D-mannose reductase